MVFKMSAGSRRKKIPPAFNMAYLSPYTLFSAQASISDLETPPSVLALDMAEYPLFQGNEVEFGDARLFIATRSRRRRYLVLDAPKQRGVLFVEKLETSAYVKTIREIAGGGGGLCVVYAKEPDKIVSVESDRGSLKFSPQPYYELSELFLKDGRNSYDYFSNSTANASLPMLSRGKYERGPADEFLTLQREKGRPVGLNGARRDAFLADLLDIGYYTKEDAALILGRSVNSVAQLLRDAGVKMVGFNKFDKDSVDRLAEKAGSRKPGDGGYFTIQEVASLRRSVYENAVSWLFRNKVPKNGRGKYNSHWVNRLLSEKSLEPEELAALNGADAKPAERTAGTKRELEPSGLGKATENGFRLDGLYGRDQVPGLGRGLANYTSVILSAYRSGTQLYGYQIADALADHGDLKPLRALGFKGYLPEIISEIERAKAVYGGRKK